MSEGLDNKKLKKLIGAFKGEMPSVRIGVLGGGKRSDGSSNAQIGAAHEYGTTTMPARSFLRQPITDEMDKQLYSSGSFDKEQLKQVVREGKITAWVLRIQMIAEKIVKEGFASNGYGKWAKWSPGYSNRTGSILVDSGQLRDSITSEVVDG